MDTNRERTPSGRPIEPRELTAAELGGIEGGTSSDPADWCGTCHPRLPSLPGRFPSIPTLPTSPEGPGI